jgi:hypothetical protein
MSSEGTGPARKAAVASQNGSADACRDDNGQGGAGEAVYDAWFQPGPKVAGGDEQDLADPRAGAGGPGEPGRFVDEDTAQWFLPTGRAALMPESMTVSADAPDERGREVPFRVETAGAPPWAGEVPVAAVAEPPPWESGPWPGPGGPRPAPRSAAAGGAHRSTTAGRDRTDGSWPVGTVLVCGLMPLVLPGLIVGFFSLRRARSAGSSQVASWIAIAASVLWAVVIVAVVSASGGSGGGCAGYPTRVTQAYGKVMADLRAGAPAQTLAADLGVAVNRTNAAAATADQITVRNALFSMASDLEQARADVTANRPVPAALRQHLTADGTALSACHS